MPLSLKEAETAAYLDPSQENLAVYVKLLEEALDNAGEADTILDVLRDHGLDDENPTGLGGELDRLADGIPLDEYDNLRELCDAAVTALVKTNPSLADAPRGAAS